MDSCNRTLRLTATWSKRICDAFDSINNFLNCLNSFDFSKCRRCRNANRAQGFRLHPMLYSGAPKGVERVSQGPVGPVDQLADSAFTRAARREILRDAVFL